MQHLLRGGGAGDMEGRLDQVRRWLERIFNLQLGRTLNFERPSLQSIDSSSLPPATRQKLHSIFGLIEKEFEVSPFHDYGYDDG